MLRRTPNVPLIQRVLAHGSYHKYREMVIIHVWAYPPYYTSPELQLLPLDSSYSKLDRPLRGLDLVDRHNFPFDCHFPRRRVSYTPSPSLTTFRSRLASLT